MRQWNKEPISAPGPIGLPHTHRVGDQHQNPGDWIRRVRQETPGPVRVHLSPDIGVDFPVEILGPHGPG
jgi:hypothetical protein